MLVLCMAVVLMLSLLPASSNLPTTGWDKSNHALAFMVLAFISYWAWPGRTVSALTGLLTYGGLIEVLQSLTPSRSAEFGDLIADGVGLLTGTLLARVVSHWMPRRQHP